MSNPLDIIRIEMQQDRLALQKTINDGFHNLNEKMDSHYAKISNLDSRISVVEDRQTIFSRGLWGLFVAVFGALLTWAFSLVKHGG